MHFAEFGVVMMLFIIGLELEHKPGSLEPPLLSIADFAYSGGDSTVSEHTCVDFVVTS